MPGHLEPHSAARARTAKSSVACWAALVALAIAIPSPQVAVAASFEALPLVEVGTQYESNPRLLTVDEDDATGLIIDSRMNMQWATEKTSIDFDPRVRLSFYADNDDSDLEDEDIYLTGAFRHRSQLSTYSLVGGYTTVGVTTSEVESAGNDTGTGSGAARFPDDSRQTWRIAPSWSRQLSPLDLVQVDLGYTDVRFDRRLSGNFPYTYGNGSLTYQRTITQKFATGLSLDGSRYESKEPETNTQNTSETFGLTGFINYAFNETLVGTINAGSRVTEVEIQREPIPGIPVCLQAGFILPCTENTNGRNFVGEASLSKESERNQYDLIISRQITPNSNGAETIRDTLDLLAHRDFTPRLAGNIGLLLFNQEDAADLTNRKRDYISVRAQLTWRLSPSWSLNGAYRYVEDDSENRIQGTNFSSNATNHYVFFGVRYAGNGWRR